MNSFRIVSPVMLTVFYGICFFKQLAMRLAGNPYRPARPGRETAFSIRVCRPGKDISGFRLTRYGIIFISCNRCGGSSMYWQTVHRVGSASRMRRFRWNRIFAKASVGMQSMVF